MHEQLKDKKLDELNQNLAGINSKLGNLWFAFGKGLLTGLGSVLGAGIAIILIGWFLNVIGVIPALSNTAEQWREAFQATQQSANVIPQPEGTPVE
jgi:hypothetical protein